MKTRLLISILCGAVLAAGPQVAGAQGILYLNDLAIGGTYDVLVMDNAAAGVLTAFGLTTHADPNGLVGVVNFIGSVGGGAFTVNVTTGLSKPVIGPPSGIDLNSVNVSSGGGGTLDIGFGDNNFTFTGTSSVVNAIGGVTAGTVSTQYFVDPGNNLFVGQSGSQGPFGPGAFAGTASFNAVGLGTPFAISEIATITHATAGTTSFNMETTVVPEPTTLVLLGTAFLGSALVRRRKKSS